jgi:signal transduction histidine kinase
VAGSGERGAKVRWSLRRRLGIAIVTAAVVILGVVSASGLLLVQTREQQDTVTVNYYNAGRLAGDVFLGLVDSQEAVRLYALDGGRTPALLEPLRQRPAPWTAEAYAGALEELAVDPAGAERLLAVQAAAQAWHDDWVVPATKQVRSGRPLSTAQLRNGEIEFRKVRDAYGTYLGELRVARADAAGRLADSTTLLFYAVLVIAIVAIAICAFLWGLLRQWVSTPVRTLAAEARIVGGGDLDHEVAVDGPPEFVALGRDVDAMRRRLVDQIAAVAEAGREIADARARLEEQAAELQRSNRELEQFAYVASHDLQEPLRKVASFCQLLEKRYSGQLDERADQYIAFAVDGAKRMQRLINDLLEFSRVGRLVSEVSDVDLEECLGMALANLESLREEAAAEITWDTLPHVRGEAPLLTQLLQNLVGNALKFQAEGRPCRIRIEAVRNGAEWEFSCADNGIGIEPEYADRVFVIFQRLHPKDVYGGTGIGLAMCKKIVEYHGGRIWVDPEVAEGATIRWTLPAIVEHRRPATRARAAALTEVTR